LGKVIESGPRRELWLDITGEQVVGVVGKRGTGKSYTLGVAIEGLSTGSGASRLAAVSTPRAALIFDILDIFWTAQIPLSDDGPPQVRKQCELMRDGGFESQALCIDVWLPAGHERRDIDPPGLNTFFLRASDLSVDDWGALFDVDIFTEPRGMLIADTVQRVSARGYRQRSGLHVPPKGDFTVEDLVTCLREDDELAENYQDMTLRSVIQRMSTYAGLALFSATGTPLTELLKPFRSSVMMLGRVPDSLKRVIVAVILRAIIRQRGDASFAAKRLDLDSDVSDEDRRRLEEFVNRSIPRCWVLMDEAHVLAGRREGSVAREAIIKFAKEGRNFGLSLGIATQQPSALDPRLMSQVETIIAHQLTAPEDAATAARAMRSPLPSAIEIGGEPADMEEVLRRLGQGEAVFSCANAPGLRRSCVILVRPRVTAHGGYEA
jgi:hypothetical protein